jgi:FtsP/CotA-like multicopper oxidase with cupredoxin domain
LAAEQFWSGMMTAVLVEDEIPVLSNFERHVMILKDITVSNGALEPYLTTMDFMYGKYGDTMTVNGQVNPVMSIKPGQVQRWTVMNGSTARFYKLQLDQHLLYVVGTDGGLLDKPYPVNSLLLAPGERVDVLIKAAANTGSYKLISLPYNSSGMGGSAIQYTLMTLAVKGTTVANNSLPVVVDPNAKRLNMSLASLPQKQITLSMGIGQAFINGQDFNVQPYTVSSTAGTLEVWKVTNATGMDHSFHIHSTSFQVLMITGGDLDYARLYTSAPAKKDVVIVPAYNSVSLLVPVGEYAGRSMFHSHILEHEDIGMLGIWEITGGLGTSTPSTPKPTTPGMTMP